MKQLFFAQKAFIVHDNQLLAVRKSADDPNQPGKWEVPGGRMEFGEEIDAHICREVMEEVGIQIAPGAPFHLWQWQLERRLANGDPVSIQIVAAARLCSPLSTELSTEGRVEEDYLGEIQWIPISRLGEIDWIPNMIPVIESLLKFIGAGQSGKAQ